MTCLKPAIRLYASGIVAERDPDDGEAGAYHDDAICVLVVRRPRWSQVRLAAQVPYLQPIEGGEA